MELSVQRAVQGRLICDQNNEGQAKATSARDGKVLDLRGEHHTICSSDDSQPELVLQLAMGQFKEVQAHGEDIHKDTHIPVRLLRKL